MAGSPVDRLLEYLRDVEPVWGYSLLLVSAYLENILPPIPGDTVTVFGAYLVGMQLMRFEWVFLTTTAGSVLGFMTIFALGRVVGRRLHRRTGGWFANPAHWERVERWFTRYGYKVVGANRFLSGARSIVALVAGGLQLDLWRVLGLATLSAVIWNGLLISLGMVVGENWSYVIDTVSRYNLVVGVVAVLIIGFVFYRSRIWRWDQS